MQPVLLARMLTLSFLWGCVRAHSDAVAATLASMTVPEKARALDIFRGADMLTNGAVDMAKAARSWGDLSLGFGVMHDVYPYPVIANAMMEALQNASRLKSPPLFGAEATHGVQMDDHTIFPSPISLAATWDVELMRRYGSVVGSEARAAGLHVAWAPVLGLCREPRWGRCEEMMGEDPHLSAALGAAAIEGMTNKGGAGGLASAAAVAPLVKHYVAYSVPEGGHNCAPMHGGRREILSTFLPSFSAALDAGAQALMVSYNEIDGEPNAASSFLLTSILRNRTGGNGPTNAWEGYVSSDFGAVSNLVDAHKVAATDADAIAQYISAGGSVQGFDFSHATWLDSIVNTTSDGRLKMADLDAAVARVLTVKERLGLRVNHATVQNTSTYEALITSKAHADVALDAARKSMTLLQNEVDAKLLPKAMKVLPLTAGALAHVLVLGPNADQPQCGDYAAGGSWGGDRCGGGPINNARTSSMLGGLKERLEETNASIAYYPGVSIDGYDASAAYYTTVQRHVFAMPMSEGGGAGREEGIEGTYWTTPDRSGKPALVRNDYMLSFHFLNYGPDPVKLPASAFSARWRGTLTPDTDVEGALFNIEGRGGAANASLWLNGKLVLRWQQGQSEACAVAQRAASSALGEEAKKPCKAASASMNHTAVTLKRGVGMDVRFEYSQADQTGQHPAFALQWSLQGANAMGDALAQIAALPGPSSLSLSTPSTPASVAVVLAVGGGTSVTSGEGVDRASMGLPGAQLAFVQAVRKACVARGLPLALVVIQGKVFGEPWIKASMPAVLEAWQGGQAQGQAIAETLLGENNPAGRTAVSFPTHTDVLPVFYNGKPTSRRGGYSNPPLIPGGLYPPASASSASVLWSFGHGLSYGATFKYGAITLSSHTVSLTSSGQSGAARPDHVQVSFDVMNNGTRAGEEVVQLYVRDELASVTTPVKQLRAFARLDAIQPGATKRVTLEIDAGDDLWLVNHAMEKVVEPGDFTIMIGGASDQIQQTALLTVVK